MAVGAFEITRVINCVPGKTGVKRGENRVATCFSYVLEASLWFKLLCSLFFFPLIFFKMYNIMINILYTLRSDYHNQVS